MSESERLLKDLNPEQREAVEYRGGPLLVLAGAGSGKTRVITYRIAHLIATGGIKPWQVLAVTFTNKAAGEMKSRIEQLVGPPAKSVWMSTFHAFGARFLRSEGHRLGLPRQFPILDEDDRLRLIREVFKDLHLDSKNPDPPMAVNAISWAKSQFKTPGEYAEEAETLYREYGQQHRAKLTIARAYEAYENRRRELHGMDFDDLLIGPLEILEQHPDVAESYRKRFVHILVDEYQDTNRPQYLLTKILAEGYRNLCVVGDDDQSIYRWRGADLRNILEFENDFPDTHTVRLESNYRSTAMILEAANDLIKKNRSRKGKTLRPTRDVGTPMRVITAVDAEDEADKIAREINTMVGSGKSRENGYPNFGDFAILYRTVAQSRALEETMVSHNIPYQVIGGIRFYERKEIKDALAYLRLIGNPEDEFSLRRVVNVPPRGIGPKTVEALVQIRDSQSTPEKPVSLFEILRRAEEFPGLSPRVKKAVSEFAQMILAWRKRAEEETFSLKVEEPLEEEKESEGPDRRIRTAESLRTGIPSFIQVAIGQSALVDTLFRSEDPKDQTAAENLRELVAAAGKMNRTVREILGAEYPDREEVPLLEALDVYLESVSLLGTIDNYEEGRGQVVLMTLHGAKGLEFPIVFLSGMEEGLCPHALSLDEHAGLEEERRLCYVGITRAKEQCYLSYASNRYINGNNQFMRPSRFLREISPNLLDYAGGRIGVGPRLWEEEPSDEDEEESSEPKKPSVGDVDFEAGDEVRHRTFGIGVVKRIEPIEGTHRVTVEFGRFGEKTFIQRVARLKKC
jgi:DNA helicase-2/ATP-dependent DNA helicase PcrA